MSEAGSPPLPADAADFQQACEAAARACDNAVRAAVTPAAFDWVSAAARVFSAELQARDARPHRALMHPLASAFGLDAARVSVLGDVMDCLQVAIDVTDNLADEEEDRANGVDRVAAYGLPKAALLCVPTLLVTGCTRRLAEHFGSADFNLARALARLSDTLCDMAVGQVAPSLEQKVALTSGRQGLLLCLPAWLVPDAQHMLPLPAFEAWAVAFGETWEWLERLRSDDSWYNRKNWQRTRWNALDAWPSVYPFSAGAPLAPDTILAPLMC